MKKKVGNIILLIFGIGILLYLVISAVMDLTNKNDLHTVRLMGAAEVLEIEHSINGLIPIGTDYYYAGVEEDGKTAYMIKASNDWLEKNFNSDYMAKDAGGLEITALGKKINSYKEENSLTEAAMQMEGADFNLGATYVLDIGYKTKALLKLLNFVLFIILVTTYIYYIRNEDAVKPVFAKVWVVVLLIALMLLLWIIK